MLRTHGECNGGLVLGRDAGFEKREFRWRRNTEGVQERVVRVDDPAIGVKGGETETGARKQAAIKRFALRFSHGSVGRTGWFGHETRRLQ